MTQIIATANHKGGVGKTTVTVNLAYALLTKNKNVLVIDIDPQAHSTEILLQRPYEDSYEEYVGNLFSKKITIEKNIIATGLGTDNLLDIVPSKLDLTFLDRNLDVRGVQFKYLSKQLGVVSGRYDYILIDCPPAFSTCTINALYAANMVIIPCIYSKLALDQIPDIIESVKEIKETDFMHVRVLRNMHDRIIARSNKFADKEFEKIEDILLATIIRKSEEINQAHMVNLPVHIYAPGKRGAVDFNKLATEILKEKTNG